MTSITQRLMEQKYELQENEDDEDNGNVRQHQRGHMHHPDLSCANPRELVRALCGELIGVIFYVFIGCMATPHPNGVDPGLMNPGAGSVPTALSQGLAIVFLTMSLMKISGAHLNPAITLGVVLCGEMGPGMGLAYTATQIVGGIVGAALCRAVLPVKVYMGIHGGAHILHVSGGSGVACETILTCIIVTTYILVFLDPKTRNKRGAIAMGFAVIVCTLAGAPSTGGSMNAVRSFGSAVAYSVYCSTVWQYHYVYWTGAVLGSLIAVLLYRLIFACPEKLLFSGKTKHNNLRNVNLSAEDDSEEKDTPN